MTSRALITEVRAGCMVSTNSVWRRHRRGILAAAWGHDAIGVRPPAWARS